MFNAAEFAELNIEPFPYEKFASEDEGTPEFVEYHSRQLKRLGVSIGRDGFKLVDLHQERGSYKLHHNDVVFSGGVDAGVVPYGTGVASAWQLMRAVFEHKQSPEAKQAFRNADSALIDKVRSCDYTELRTAAQTHTAG